MEAYYPSVHMCVLTLVQIFAFLSSAESLTRTEQLELCRLQRDLKKKMQTSYMPLKAIQ